MERFWTKNDREADNKYKTWCKENPKGFVFNYIKGGEKSDDMNVLHHVNCSKLDQRGKSTSYEKVCSISKEELEQFANEDRGFGRWKHCSHRHCFG
jgi:hypothetical protein